MMVLFVWGKIRYDLTALLGLLVGMAVGIVPVDKAFGGFSDQVVIIVGAALIISAGVGKSGVIGRIIRNTEPRMRTVGSQVIVLTSAVAVLSSFMKNIGALAIFLPVALQIARRSGTSASTLLMPMAFGSLIGGLVTLVGTSPNLLVSRVREEVIGRPYAMFDFAPVGLGILVVALAFLAIGWRLLPPRVARGAAEDSFNVDAYVIEATLAKTSRFVDKTVHDLESLAEGGVTIIAIVREGGIAMSRQGIGRCLLTTCLCCRGMLTYYASSPKKRVWKSSAPSNRPVKRVRLPNLAWSKLSSWQGRRSSIARPKSCCCETNLA